MAKHWRDQFRDNSAARAAEEEKRVANSEGWEEAGDPGPNARAGRRSLQLGVRSASASKPQFARGGGKAGISMRVGGGVPFEKAAKPQPPAVEPTPAEPEDNSSRGRPGADAAGNQAPTTREEKGILSKLSSLFGKRGDR